MLITRQKFRLCMLGYYIRLCHIIMCNKCEMWGLFYSRTMRTLPMSCHVLPDVQSSWPPYVCVVRQELLMDIPIKQAKRYLSKITASHFSTLNMDFGNQNVLKRILIAMLNENKADCNENFSICTEEPVAPLYKQ